MKALQDRGFHFLITVVSKKQNSIKTPTAMYAVGVSFSIRNNRKFQVYCSLSQTCKNMFSP